MAGVLKTYHYAWLEYHPERTPEWLRAKMSEGFHIHHVDGDWRNEAASNLILMDGADHMRLHGCFLPNLRGAKLPSNEGRKAGTAVNLAHRVGPADPDYTDPRSAAREARMAMGREKMTALYGDGAI